MAKEKATQTRLEQSESVEISNEVAIQPEAKPKKAAQKKSQEKTEKNKNSIDAKQEAQEKAETIPVAKAEAVDRKNYLDHIRIIAALFVIAIHVVSFFLNQRKAAFGSAAWNIEIIMDNFIRVAVPLYVMISGAIFLDETRKVTIKKLLLNNVLRMVVIFLFWALFYRIGIVLTNDKFTWQSFLDCFVAIGKGDYHYHLWYLPMLIGLYLITPLLRCMCKKENKKLVEYFLIVFMVCVGVINFFSHKDLGETTNVIFNIADQLTPETFVNFMGVYVLGWYLSAFDHSKKFKIILYSVGFGLYVLGAGADVLYAYVRGKTDFFSSNNLGFFKLLPAAAIFLAFRYSKFANKENKFIKYLSGCTFGIYLTHPFLRNFIFTLMGDSLMLWCETGWAALIIPLYTIIIFIVSFGVSAVVSLLPKKIRKWLM